MSNKDITNPDHYTGGTIECIESIKSALGKKGFTNYLQGNLIKYLWRCQQKNSYLQDLKKAEWFLNRLILECEIDE